MHLGARAALLAGVPLVIMTAIGIALLAQGKVEDGRSSIAVGVIVAAVGGAATLYWIDRWSLARKTLVHTVVMALTALPAMALSGWFPLDTVWGWVLLVGTWALGGAVGWTIGFLATRKRTVA